MAEGKKGPDNGVGEKVESSGKKKGGLVIFAVDISGSMCTTTEVPALQGITYDLSINFLLNIPYSVSLSVMLISMHCAAEWASAAGRGGGTRYISRLEAIKEAVGRHLEHMALTNPNNTV